MDYENTRPYKYAVENEKAHNIDGVWYYNKSSFAKMLMIEKKRGYPHNILFGAETSKGLKVMKLGNLKLYHINQYKKFRRKVIALAHREEQRIAEKARNTEMSKALRKEVYARNKPQKAENDMSLKAEVAALRGEISVLKRRVKELEELASGKKQGGFSFLKSV